VEEKFKIYVLMLKGLEKKEFKISEIRGVQERCFYGNLLIFRIFRIFNKDKKEFYLN
jgi:hypothetical protein